MLSVSLLVDVFLVFFVFVVVLVLKLLVSLFVS